MNAPETESLPANTGGRPSKFIPSTRARLVELVAKGVPFVHACHAVGITSQSFCNYRDEHPDFREEIEAAVAVAISKRLDVIERAAESGDVGCAKWLLEHLHPNFFARSRLEVSGPDGAPLTGVVAVYLPAKDAEDGSPALTLENVKEVDDGN